MAHRLNNPLFQYANEKLQTAERLGRADVENFLHDQDHGLGALTRKMSPEEQINAWALVNAADKLQKDLPEAWLRERGATDAQIAYIKAHREAMDYGYNKFAKPLEAMGHKPVPKRVGYAAMLADGDWRAPVKDANGDIVGMIGSDLKWRFEGLKKEMEARGWWEQANPKQR
jgi:hypothetical protein